MKMTNREKLLEAIRESKASSFSDLMNYLYEHNWELGLELIDDVSLREYAMLLLTENK